MTSREAILEACQTEFHFLETDFDVRPVEASVTDWGARLSFKGDTVGVVLSFELRDFYLFVELCRLHDGEFPEKPGEIRPETQLHRYDLDDITFLANKEALIPAHALDTQLNMTLARKVVTTQAHNLREYASDILKGKFDAFVDLDRLVKARARDAAFKKWGNRATDYGWT